LEVRVLLGFQVSNHRSFLDTAELSMSAVDQDRPAARQFDRLSERVLTVAGIFGPNASGKSNLLSAIAWLSNAVRNSLRRWDEFVPRDPHRFGKGPATPSVFDISLVVAGIEYQYHLEVDDESVLYEELRSYPKQRRRVLFERHGAKVEFGRGLVGTRAVRQVLTETTLALSAGMRFRVPDIEEAGRSVAGLRAIGMGWMPFDYSIPPSTRHLFSGDSRQLTLDEMFDDPKRDLALDLLRWADPGIDNVRIIEQDEEGGSRPGRSRQSLRARRRTEFVRHIDDEEYSIDFGEESAGTRKWYSLLGPVLASLSSGDTLLFDEIDQSLHPRLSSQLIELYQDPQTNPQNAQLIFTTHDPSLLNVLNRDEVWLTEKEPDGASILVALAEYGGTRVRKSLNLERAYLQGRFGAVPEIDQIAIRRALGLAARAG
jgi:hypothetical protein